MPDSFKKRILFLYPDPPGFSGQRRASELMLEVFEGSESFQLLPVKLPGLPKTGGGVFAYLNFAMAMTWSIFSVVRHAVFSNLSGGFIALCQTKLTLVREHSLLRLIRFLSRKPNLPFGYRLDGSNFTGWADDEDIAKKFRHVLSEGKFVSVLGPTQKKIADDRFRSRDLEPVIVPNTCEFKPISMAEIVSKQTGVETLKILHLSSLMEPKGFVEFAESTSKTSDNTQLIVCGKITSTQYDQKFKTVGEATDWLRKQASDSERLSWVEGAYGEEKRQLFLQSHVFVMPTDYPVEAQPLVLLEAMACGCAIITTDVGEIPYMVDDSCALVLKKRCSDEIAKAIEKLHDEKFRQQLAVAGHERFLSRFSMQQNLETWRSIFQSAY